MKMFFRIALIGALPFIAYFPSALLLYWVTNNSVSLINSLLLKQPSVRRYFNIPTIPPKPQPGEVGYVPEPSFSEAFKNMQTGMQDKWDETKEKADAEQKRRDEWAGKNERKEVYAPRAPSVKRRVLEEVDLGEGGRGEIKAVAQEEGAMSKKEQEKARRVQAARERRLRNQ